VDAFAQTHTNWATEVEPESPTARPAPPDAASSHSGLLRTPRTQAAGVEVRLGLRSGRRVVVAGAGAAPVLLLVVGFRLQSRGGRALLPGCAAALGFVLLLVWVSAR
jgi:hypothetical protein